MTNEELALKVNDHEHEIGILKHRMKAVEENQNALNSLATVSTSALPPYYALCYIMKT